MKITLMDNKIVLIVEDDKDIRENLQELLDSEGYRVEQAENGLVALEFLRTTKELPGLIFLDIMMPVMDGQTFLEEVQKDAILVNIPIIVISAASKIDGSIGFMKKPLDLIKILDAAEKYCK